MVCNTDCRVCNAQGNDIQIRNFSPPAKAIPGSTITLTFDIWHCGDGWCGEKYFIACAYDNYTGQCQSSTEWTHILAGQTITSMQLQITMPENRSFNGNLSVTGMDYAGLIIGCAYSSLFSIGLDVPPSTRWSCNSNTKSCYQDAVGYYSSVDACVAACGGGGGGLVQCSADEIKILGTCLPKNVVFIGAGLAALYIFSKG